MSRRERDVYRRAKLTKDAEAPAVEGERVREGEVDVDSANERDVPYQSLLKVFLAERLDLERARKRKVG